MSQSKQYYNYFINKNYSQFITPPEFTTNYRAYRNTISKIDPRLHLNTIDPLVYFNKYRSVIKNDFSREHEENFFFTYEDVLLNNTTWITVEDYIKTELYKTKSISEILTKFVLDENKYEIVPSKKHMMVFLKHIFYVKSCHLIQ